ncbi:hypothetical protein CDL15_Pgr023528 [Punica granatum]|uniref:Uncharacterized protein n=1 Tax=Punica granatum TaxID=22663 RepID=A0A218W7P7_PUNGR|nr:hypothetical protein CDL15_Pgr023528 [Punica granatum]
MGYAAVVRMAEIEGNGESVKERGDDQGDGQMENEMDRHNQLDGCSPDGRRMVMEMLCGKSKRRDEVGRKVGERAAGFGMCFGQKER